MEDSAATCPPQEDDVSCYCKAQAPLDFIQEEAAYSRHCCASMIKEVWLLLRYVVWA